MRNFVIVLACWKPRYSNFRSKSTIRLDSRNLPAKRPRCLTQVCPRNGDRRGMGSGLSMRSRAEVTSRFARKYVKAS
ncbi:hypothetical protein GIY30_11690 [Gordonia sp. HNM0687]|uniref:Uncharacterized protein n=1 Tax=Gordonia mangrovi TaxID=2665643 RepID=A0A6L7GQ30_9ACTN|nr:hypothetical protein [Gordonia mangrovi]